jgi:hypothetical protein
MFPSLAVQRNLSRQRTSSAKPARGSQASCSRPGRPGGGGARRGMFHLRISTMCLLGYSFLFAAWRSRQGDDQGQRWLVAPFGVGRRQGVSDVDR